MKNYMKTKQLEKPFLHVIQTNGSGNRSAPDVAGEKREKNKN